MTVEGSRVPKHFSLRGEWVELCFMARAAERGIRAIRPWGDCSRYDFIVETGGEVRRVQVKSTSYLRGKQYTCALRGANRKAYTKAEIDFFSVFVIPVDAWYIFRLKRWTKGRIASAFRRITRCRGMRGIERPGICFVGRKIRLTARELEGLPRKRHRAKRRGGWIAHATQKSEVILIRQYGKIIRLDSPAIGESGGGW